jgi:uncharacterized protein YndB with AHSA1/START domain
MLKKILIGLAVLIAAVLLFAMTKPDSFSVQRTATIKAPPEKLFAMVDDFHQWGAWSPWEKLDPSMKRTFSGPATGKGSIYAWDGNGKAGAGQMEITEATPTSKVAIKLDFLRPFVSTNSVEFAFQPHGDSTTIVWTMSGPSNYMSKVMQVFMSMDKMIGKDFEAGLTNLRTAAEK